MKKIILLLLLVFSSILFVIDNTVVVQQNVKASIFSIGQDSSFLTPILEKYLIKNLMLTTSHKGSNPTIYIKYVDNKEIILDSIETEDFNKATTINMKIKAYYFRNCKTPYIRLLYIKDKIVKTHYLEK